MRSEPTSTRAVPPYLTCRDVAAMLGVAPFRVRDWHRRGTGPVGVRVDGVLRWDPADVRDWAQRADWPCGEVPR